jgi:cyclopropane fatty-acyl-phospholipid synthase-like methyltransferase
MAFGAQMTNIDRVKESKHRRAFNETARRVAPDDFWAQVQRTVNGRVVDESQIALIVDAVCAGLALEENDTLLDLCCGNGALTDRLFARCRGGLGVDFADELIAVAQRYFERAPARRYVCADASTFIADAAERPVFTKALCYGSLQLLAPEQARALLATLRVAYPSLTRVFVGNLPDRALAANFYTEREPEPGELDDHERPIGMWRTADECRELAASAGWACTIRRMPAAFFGAHYRFDMLLEPSPGAL